MVRGRTTYEIQSKESNGSREGKEMTLQQPEQVKLCECGCKEEMSFFDKRGRPRRFINGHQRRGKKQSEETKRKLSESRLNNYNPNWRNEDVQYRALHVWVRHRLSISKLCELCNLIPPRDLANITGVYSRDLSNWKYLCRSCHLIFHRRIDHTNTRCSICASNETYIDKRRDGPLWQKSKITGELLCSKCYNKEYDDLIANKRKSKKDGRL